MFLNVVGNNPAPIEIKTTPLKLEKVQDIPVAVIASNRPHYLYRGLRSMLSAHGAKKELFTVFIDGFFEEPAAVARLYDVKVVQHIPISSKNARISQVGKAFSLRVFTRCNQNFFVPFITF